MNKADLKLDWCSYEAAKYAVEHWHYSRTMPAGKRIMLGVWERGQYIGAVIFSWGANNHIGNPYGLKMTQVCELVRVALTVHLTPVSRIVSVATKMLAKQSPGLRLIVSYADPEQNHVGGIYQAGGWVYTGSSQAQRFALRLDGSILHKRTAHSLFGTVKGLDKSNILWKHKYIYPLDPAMRQQIAPLAKPYPKRGTGETVIAPQSNAESGGSTPTVPLLENDR